MNSFSILLEALINDGYSEKDACDLIVKFVEEHKQYDEIAKLIHELYINEINDSDSWS